MKRIFFSLAGSATLFCLMAAPVQSVVVVPPPVEPQVQADAETFMGTVLKNGEHFVLSDPATTSRYLLDDSKRASSFEGKTVIITGTIDMASNLIHVENIQEIAWP